MARRNRNQMIYKRLAKLIDFDLLKEKNELKYLGGAFMDLIVQWYYQPEGERYFVITLGHYYEQNGDLVPDPRMDVRIYSDMEWAEPESFEDYRGYQRVYFKNSDGQDCYYPRLKRSLTDFLDMWVKNIEHQGHKLQK